jgi:hypothetical protein
MFMGLSDMVPVEVLEKIRDEMKTDYKKRNLKEGKASTTGEAMRTAEYFLREKRKKISNI